MANVILEKNVAVRREVNVICIEINSYIKCAREYEALHDGYGMRVAAIQGGLTC